MHDSLKITCIKFARQSIGRLNIPVSSPISKMSRAILLDCPNWQAKKPIHLKAATTTVTTFHRTPEEKADPRKRALSDGQTFCKWKTISFHHSRFAAFFFLSFFMHILSFSFFQKSLTDETKQYTVEPQSPNLRTRTPS